MRITQALRRLGALAREEGVTLEVSLYGGAVFTLVYGSRDATKDVDALVRPAAVAQKLAKKVAAELDLPEDWLNDNVKQFLAEKETMRELVVPLKAHIYITGSNMLYWITRKPAITAGIPANRDDET